MKDYLSPVQDVFDMHRRIKEIDPKYELFFNRINLCFEVHKNGRKEICVPGNILDSRLMDFLRYTRVERIEQTMKDIEEANTKLEEKEVLNKINNVKDVGDDMVRFLRRKNYVY